MTAVNLLTTEDGMGTTTQRRAEIEAAMPCRTEVRLAPRGSGTGRAKRASFYAVCSCGGLHGPARATAERAGRDAREHDDSRRWRWTMNGTAAASGTLARSAEETGEVDAECAGEVVEHVVKQGWWDSFDQDEPVTITVEPL